MIEKFDQHRKNLLISVSISILILFFNLEIDNIDFFEKISIPKKLNIYFILLVNSYFYYEIITSWFLLELDKNLNKRIYKLHFTISTLAYSSIILFCLIKSIKFNIVLNYIIFGIIIFVLINSLYSIYYNIRKLIISLNYSKIESIFNIGLLLINLLLVIFIFFHLKTSDLKNLDIIHYTILLVFMPFISYLHIDFIINHKYFKNYKNRILYFNEFKTLSSILKEINKKKNTEEIQKEIKEFSTSIENIQNIPLENKIVNYINSGNINSVKEIFNKNKEININLRRYNGWTFLHDAVSQGEYEIAKFLLENGSETDISNQMGLYPINFAVNYNNLEILRLLIDYHANIEVKDKFGFPPIYKAISNDNLEIVKLLIQNGAKFKQKNNGMTPLEYAKRERKGKIAKYLKDMSK